IDTAEKIAVAFEEKYPGSGVEVVRATTGVIYQRLMQEAQLGVNAADVYSTTDEGHAVALNREGMFECFTPPDVEHVIEALRGADRDGCYHITSAWLILMTYNTSEVPASEAPKDWKDLLDARWKGKLAIGHPAYSGSVATWVN